jgi:SAM-dependent methyltransferase
MLAAGASVRAVEPDPVLAEHLQAEMGAGAALEVTVAAFEDAPLARHAYDLAVAATSFHWVDPDRGLTRVLDVLRPGGWWAMWWNVFGDPEQPDAFHTATNALLEPLMDSPSAGARGVPFALHEADRLADLAAAGFEAGGAERVVTVLTMTAEQIRALYATFSPIRRLDRAARDRLLDTVAGVAARDFGGRVELHLLTALYTARAPAPAQTPGGD